MSAKDVSAAGVNIGGGLVSLPWFLKVFIGFIFEEDVCHSCCGIVVSATFCQLFSFFHVHRFVIAIKL